MLHTILLVGIHLSLLFPQVTPQPVLGDIHTSAPVAVKGEDFTFYADISWMPIDYDGLVYWRVCESNACDSIVKEGSFNSTEDDVLVNSISEDISDNKLGKNRYVVEMSLNRDYSDYSTHSAFFVHVVPGAVTLLPPIITVIVAVSTRNVLLSLYLGIFFAGLLIWNYNPFYAFINSFSQLIVSSFSDKDHIFIVLFTWILSGMISCVMKAGGGEGLVNSLAKYATSPRAGMLVAFALGMMIFFDDYANTLIVGQTVRPIIDSLGVSREKLAFLVDSTAAPVASVSPISSWIGFELSLIEDALAQLEDAGEDLSCYDSSAFIIFLNTIPSRFYPILVLALQFFLIVTGMEYGPMLSCERKARAAKADGDRDAEASTDTFHTSGDAPPNASLLPSLRERPERHSLDSWSYTISRAGRLSVEDAAKRRILANSDTAGAAELEPNPGTPRRWYNAVFPIGVTITVVIISLICTGVTGIRKGEDSFNLQNIFANSDSFTSLLYGSIAGTLTIWLMCWVERITPEGTLTTIFHTSGRAPGCRPLIPLEESLEVFIFGIKNLVNALLILILAWTVGDAFTQCGTGVYISSALEDSVDAGAYPALTFVISAVLALVTGSSWGTMSIMFPLILPAAHYADPCNKAVFYGTISSILAGAVLGDHCSPISDTTVLASVATKCDLMSHVKTQLPYAALCGAMSILLGDLPTGYKVYNNAVGILVGVVTLYIIVFCVAVKTDSSATDKVTLSFKWLKSLLTGSISSVDRDAGSGVDDPLLKKRYA